MNESRRLGKGLEDISHLFLSSEEERSTLKKNPDTDAGEISPGTIRTSHYVCLVGDQPDLHHAFLVFQLSSALAKFSKRTAVVDMDEELPCLHFLMGDKAGSDISINPSRFIREGPSGVKVVGLSETVIAEMSGAETTGRILRDLKKMEEEHEVILLSVVQETLLRMEIALPDPLKEFILLVARDKFKMLAAYKTIKAIFSLHPLAHAGTIVTPINHPFEADLVNDRMSGAVGKFLNRELHGYGFLYKTEKVQDASLLNDSFPDADHTACIPNIVQNLIMRLNLKESSSQGHFFSNLFAEHARMKSNG